MGDLYDQFSFSKFAKTHDLMTPKEEILEGRAGAENMWAHIKKIAPNAERIQLRGNHDVRIQKRVLEVLPEIEFLITPSVEELFKFKGVQTVIDTRAEFEIDGVIYTHGHYMKNGDHAKYYNKPVVHGHRHRGEAWFHDMDFGMLWELDCGYCSDQSQVPMRYTATKTTHWTLGVGEIDRWGPRFIPYSP